MYIYIYTHKYKCNDICFSEYLNVKLRRRTSEREVDSAAVEIDHTYTHSYLVGHYGM